MRLDELEANGHAQRLLADRFDIHPGDAAHETKSTWRPRQLASQQSASTTARVTQSATAAREVRQLHDLLRS